MKFSLINYHIHAYLTQDTHHATLMIKTCNKWQSYNIVIMYEYGELEIATGDNSMGAGVGGGGGDGVVLSTWITSYM